MRDVLHLTIKNAIIGELKNQIVLMYFYLPGSFGRENILNVTGWPIWRLECTLINSYNLNGTNLTL
jgi:hypothetical protein